MKYLLEANESHIVNHHWELVWYDDQTEEITRERVEENE